MNANAATTQNYRSYLRQVLIEKQKKNPKFSLRSFSKMLGVQSSFLSMVMNGKRDLSEETAAEIGTRLNLSDTEFKKFNLLVRLEKTTSAQQRKQILEDLEALDPTHKGNRDLALDQFRVISDWYHLPLQILIDLDGFEWSEERAAKALGISTHEVKEALERLAALELIELEPSQRPRKAPGRLMVDSPFKNEALRKYHTQMLEKNIEALIEQGPEERFTGTLNIALDQSQLTAVRKIMKETQEKIGQIAETRSKKKKLYHANFNLFCLTKGTHS